MSETSVPAPRPRRLVGLASILVDVTLGVPRLPARGGDLLAEDLGVAAGGGINALVAAARLGLPTVYAGPHGSGRNGDTVRASLAADGIGLVAPASPGADTGYCLALVEPDGERTFVTVAGAEAVQTGERLAAVPLSPGDALYASGYDLAYPGSGPALAAYLSGLPPTTLGGPLLVLDPGPLVGELDPQPVGPVLARVDVLTLSSAELAAVGGVDGVRERLCENAVLVGRDGPDGAWFDWAGTVTRVGAPAAPGPVLDTNGAGDTHTGALLTGLHLGLAWAEAVRLANHAAAWSVTRRGAASGPTWGELAAAFPGLGSPVWDH